MRIAVDVMGGDYGCGIVIDGVRQALASELKITELFLVGHQREIEACLSSRRLTDPRLQIVHASEVLAMEDKPVEGLRRKKDCSILRTVDLERGEADFSSNTGGMLRLDHPAPSARGHRPAWDRHGYSHNIMNSCQRKRGHGMRPITFLRSDGHARAKFLVTSGHGWYSKQQHRRHQGVNSRWAFRSASRSIFILSATSKARSLS
jgi:hypothetical protein